MRKNIFADNLRVEPTILFVEKISFSLKLFSCHFYGQLSEVLSTVCILFSADSRRVVVSYKRTYVLEVLVNCIGKQRVVR